jgi:hypothetical protein
MNRERSSAVVVKEQRARWAARGVALASLALLAVFPAVSGAQAPVGPPGPPPGNGGTLPAAPGTAMSVVPPGTAATLPAGPLGPGLLSDGNVGLSRATRTFSLPFACQGKGSVSIRSRLLSKVTLAKSGYRCTANRAKVKLRLSSKVAKRLARRQTVAATAVVRQSGKTWRLSFSMRSGGKPPAAKGFWTDGHLQCTNDAGAPQAYLVEPDFTTKSPTPVSTRGWIAWYTPASGWHWLGVGGERVNRWNNWSASVSGIAQFHPSGAPNPIPWTWGPVTIPSGQSVSAVGVYEIVYWVGGKPEYQWQYVNAGPVAAPAAGGGHLYCSY